MQDNGESGNSLLDLLKDDARIGLIKSRIDEADLKNGLHQALAAVERLLSDSALGSGEQRTG